MYIVKARNQPFVLRLEAKDGHEEESSCLRHYYATLTEHVSSKSQVTWEVSRLKLTKKMEERYHSIAIWHASVGRTSIVAGISTTHIQALIMSLKIRLL